jgi:hypothetical protein
MMDFQEESAMALGGYMEYVPPLNYQFFAQMRSWQKKYDCWLALVECQDEREHPLFFHFDVSPVSSAIAPLLAELPPRTIFSEPPVDVTLSMTSLAEASAILLALWVEVERMFWRIGASGV